MGEGFHDLVVVTLKKQLLDVSKSVLELALSLHDQHVQWFIGILDSVARDWGRRYAVVQAQVDQLLNILYHGQKVDRSANFGLIVLALREVLKQVAATLTIEALLKQTDVNVGYQFLNVYVLGFVR